MGSLKVEVVDTERFNQEINLGEVNLLLSSLMHAASGIRSQSQLHINSSPISEAVRVTIK